MDVYKLRIGTEYDSKTWEVPTMPTRQDTVSLALDWANSLAKHSNQTVIILRNGITLLDVPAK